MVFKTKEIETQALGEKLKNARGSMKMALWQASRKTKIPVNYLKYLESGKYDELPADVYIVAYLKKYAQVLKLDADEILEQFKAEKGITANLPESSETVKKPLHFLKRPLLVTPKRLSLVLAIMVIGLIFGYFWHQISYLINPPSIKITQPIPDFATQARSVEISGQTESDVYLTVNGKEIYVDKKGNFSSVVGLESGLNILRIEARDRFGKTTTIIRRVMVTK